MAAPSERLVRHDEYPASAWVVGGAVAVVGLILTSLVGLVPQVMARRNADRAVASQATRISNDLRTRLDGVVTRLRDASGDLPEVEPMPGPSALGKMLHDAVSPAAVGERQLVSSITFVTSLVRESRTEKGAFTDQQAVRYVSGDLVGFSSGDEVERLLEGAQLPNPPTGSHDPELVDLRASKNVIGELTAASAATEQGRIFALAVPVHDRGWLLAPLEPGALSAIVHDRPEVQTISATIRVRRRGAMRPIVTVSTPGGKQLQSVRNMTLGSVASTFDVTVNAPNGFGTTTRDPRSTLVAGLSVTAIAALLAGARRHRRRSVMLEAELATANHLARTDELTSLANRFALVERLDALLRDGATVSLILGDLDRFKVINDSRGHEVGDQVLVDVAQRLREAARPHTVHRLGGDEFVVLIDRGLDTAVGLAAKLSEALRRPITVGHDAVVVGISLGVASTDLRKEVNRSDLLRDADIAMYAAKRMERTSRIAVADGELLKRNGGQLDLELGVRAALGTDQICTWYQPIVNAQREVCALEALVRWQHPTDGLLPPGRFLPAAKEAGLLGELSTAVLARACEDVAEWNRQRGARGQRPLLVHVNCVEEQIIDPSFPDVVATYVAMSGISPSSLLLEISEETAMDRLPADLPTLRAIREQGIEFSLDDFGFGNTSLTMVRQLGDVAEIKLDKSIVDDIAAPDADLTIARTIIDFAKSRHMSIVAEGIEHEEQFRVLNSLGVDLFQGYLFHRPMSAEALRQLLLGTNEVFAAAVV